MSDIRSGRKALMKRILEGGGHASTDARRAAYDKSGLEGPLDTLLSKVAARTPAVVDDDFSAAKAAGFTEDQLFEIVVCAAIGQASREYDAALAALDAAKE